MKRKKYSNTLIGRFICMIGLVTVLLLGAASVIITCWTTNLLKPELQRNLSVLTGAVSAKASYILHQNTQYLIKYCDDETLLDEMIDYGEQWREGGQAAEKAADIASKLEEQVMGTSQPGAIVSNRNVIAFMDGQYIAASPRAEAYVVQISGTTWFEQLSGYIKNASRYSGRYPINYSSVFPEEADNKTEEFIAMAMVRSYEKHEFYFIMIEPFSDFRTIFGDFLNAGIEDFCLVGREEEILFMNNESSFFSNMSKEEREQLFVEDQYAVNQQELSANSVLGVRISYNSEQLKIAVCLPDKELLKLYFSYVRLINGMLVVFTCVLITCVIVIFSNSIKNIKRLARQMRNVQENDYHISRIVSSKDEVGVLAETFYQMMDQIQENIEKIHEQEEKEKRIEYSLLVSQIDPHFIYNTLNTITYLAELNRAEDITVINKSLIGMLRDRLKMTHLQIFDTLENEKKQLDAYITIQKYLCSSELSLEFYVSEECGELQYPKNILQPLVENSILHGCLVHYDRKHMLVSGKIRISISIKNEMVITKIQDNGVGMGPEEIRKYFVELPELYYDKETDVRQHIGIYNIRMRLSYLYGEKFRIEAAGQTEGGLAISLFFPACKISPISKKT